LNAQDEQPKTNSIKGQSISLGLMGAPAWPIGISYGQMLTNRISFEIGVGLVASGAGITYFITDPRNKRLILHAGLFAGINYSGFGMYYLPVGVTYFSKKNFQFSVDVGVMSSKNVSLLENGNNPSPWFGLKVGRRFGNNIESLESKEKNFKKNIICAKLGADDPWIGITYERLLSQYIGTEVQIGLVGAALGAKFYYPGNNTGRTSLYVGVMPGWGFMGGLKTYFPIGISIMTKDNERISFDAGPRIWHDDEEENFLGFSIKVGKAF
jgi:hypothetical protein